MNTCSECGDDKPRVLSGKTHAKGRKVYHDATGRQWKGLICPDCRSGTSDEKVVILTHRTCRICENRLTTSRYFDCEDCVPELESDDDDLTIHHY